MLPNSTEKPNLAPATLILFAKHWTPGHAKTRLIPRVGEAGGAKLQKLFLATTLKRVSGLFERHILAITPADKQQEFADLAGPGWRIVDQGTGDLGERLERMVHFAHRQGSERVLVIGSDSPDLPTEYLTQAEVLLYKKDAVIGPADDGGYYLLGFSAEPCSLKNIAWGSNQVRLQTEAKLQESGYSYAALPTWSDVDFLADLDALLNRIQALTGKDAALAELDQQIREILAISPGILPLR